MFNGFKQIMNPFIHYTDECTGDLEVEQLTSSTTLDRVVLFQQLAYGSCIDKLTIDSIRPNIEFDLNLWSKPEPVDDDEDLNSKQGTLLKSITIRTTARGIESFMISELCAPMDAYVGFTFRNR